MLQKLFVILVNLIAKTWRISLVGDLPQDKALIGFWHGQMMPVWYFFRKSSPVAIVSKSKDGQVLCEILSKWGLKTIRGSSSKDGDIVLQQMIKQTNNGLVLLTPDGPRGPKQKMKAGIVIASQRSQKPFYFINVDIKSKWIFSKSWDNFNFPKPFTKITLSISNKLLVNKDLNRDAIDNLIADLNTQFANESNSLSRGEIQ